MTAPAPAIELGFFVEHEALFYKASTEQPCLKICQAFEITDIAQNAGKAEYVIKISFQSVAQQKQTILIDLRWSNNKLRSMLDAAAFEIDVNDTLKLSHLPRSMFKKRGVKVSHC